MGDPEFYVVLVALIVSVIALAVTTFQLSAQISSTAEGQRKCSESLLSSWAKDSATKAHRKWRWSEARYELRFVTPEIYLGTSASPIADEGDKAREKDRCRFWTFYRALPGTWKQSKRKIESVLGADSGLDYVLFESALADNAPDMVSWLSFLIFLRLEISDPQHRILREEILDASRSKQVMHKKPYTTPLKLSWPRVRYRVHSWDYMPPNAPKPFAKFTIHDIAVLVGRSGMAWKTFDPKNGNVSAEGGAHILTGSLIPGLGLVLEYRCLYDKLLATRVSREIATKSDLPVNRFTRFQRWALNKARIDAFRPVPSDEESWAVGEAYVGQREERRRSNQRGGVWSEEMDKFIFGLIPGDPRLDIQDFPFVQASDCLHAILSHLSCDVSLDLILDLPKDTHLYWRYSFNDLMAMIPPTLKTSYNGTPPRLPFKGYFHGESVFTWTLPMFGRLLRAFLNRGTRNHKTRFESLRPDNPKLTEENFGESLLGQTGLLHGRDDGGTAQMKHVLDGVDDMIRRIDFQDYLGRVSPWFSDKLHEYHASTTQYFIDIRATISMKGLLRAFLSKAPLAAREVWRNENEVTYISGCTGPQESYKTSCILEHYFSYIPDYVDIMKRIPRVGRYLQPLSSDINYDDVVIEAWITLMWRGYLFRYLHRERRNFQGIYVPHEYYKSRLPVYMI